MLRVGVTHGKGDGRWPGDLDLCGREFGQGLRQSRLDYRVGSGGQARASGARVVRLRSRASGLKKRDDTATEARSAQPPSQHHPGSPQVQPPLLTHHLQAHTWGFCAPTVSRLLFPSSSHS